MKNLEFVESINLPTTKGTFKLSTYKTSYPKQPNMKYALVVETRNMPEIPLIRIHSSCIFSEVLDSQLCDCREQLDTSLDLINKNGGILFYLDQEGRGHGLFNKTKEMKLQEEGLDTVEASTSLDLDVDNRDYEVVKDLLQDMNIIKVKVLTNNPKKLEFLESSGITYDRVPIETIPNIHNEKYQRTKKLKMDHFFNKYIKS